MKIGELTLENDFLSGALGRRVCGRAQDDDRPRPWAERQPPSEGPRDRSSVYYLPRPTSDADLMLMRRIDELHLEYPFTGSWMLKGLLQAEEHHVGRLHVSTLMKKMAIQALYRRPNTSKPAPGHKIYPYLLRNLAVTRPNQVWRWTSPTFRWPGASSISPPSSTGSVERP